MLKKNVKVLMILPLLLHTVTMETTDDLRFNILKFGKTENDYVMFQHDMSQFETGFTLCTWVRKLYSLSTPTWFSYAATTSTYEIQMSDDGSQTYFFADTSNPDSLASLYTVTPGTWFHNCLSWDSATSTRDVYIDGVRIDSKATPAGRTLGQGGTIVLGNEQSGLGTGMDYADVFGGELYKLNMFTRKLTDGEIKEMSEERCSEVEMKYNEDERGLKWEDILQKKTYGNVVEEKVNVECMRVTKIWNKLLDTKKELDVSKSESYDSLEKLDDKILQLSIDFNDILQNIGLETKIVNSKTNGELQRVEDESQEISER